MEYTSFIVIFMITEYLLKNSALIKCLMTMSPTLKKLAVALAAIIILLNVAQANLEFALSEDTSGKIDLFTQKDPYNGKGPNVPSDAFGPEEIVILHALVTYNEVPVQNLPVAFCVYLPSDKAFSLTARTDLTGIATVDFAVLTPPINISESEVFGNWSATANVLIDDYIFQDTVAFQVDWIVKLISMRAIDGNLVDQTIFGTGGDVGLEITLRSIAMSLKNATLAIVIQDVLNVPINFFEISDFKVQPSGKLVFLYCRLFIPKWAYTGKATAYVSALTKSVNAGGVPYCPGVSTEFLILPNMPLNVTFHDVAVVWVTTPTNTVEPGQQVNVDAVIQNEGTETESVNVNAYFDSVSVKSLNLTLAPYSSVTLNFTFDTLTMEPGNYTIIVSIPQLVNEADLTDNVYVDGVIKIGHELPEIVHDIAIVSIKTSTSSVYIGELLQINVTIFNKGTETETFNASTYYGSSKIETNLISALSPSAQTTTVFVWNTTSVAEGFYQISASSPLLGDANTSDNILIDGIVQVKAKPHPFVIRDIAVLNVVPSSTLAYTRTSLNVTVTLKNKGNQAESFNVTLYYDSSIVATLRVDDLVTSTEHSLVFNWNTQGVSEGKYTLSAFAFLPSDINFSDNTFTDGVVEIVEAPKGWFIPDWFYRLLPFILILIFALLILLFYSRRRKKREEAFYSGWTAWYYCYDLRSKLHKI